MPTRRRAVPLLAALLAALPDADAAFPPPLARRAEVAAVAAEMDLPPTHPDEPPLRLPDLPFRAAALKGYGPDAVPLDAVRDRPKEYPYRSAVLAAYQTIRESWTLPPATKPEPVKGKKKLPAPATKFPRTLFVTAAPAPLTEDFKGHVRASQTFPALAVTKLELAADALAKVADRQAGQPKRWRAHYTYALAQCLNRQAFLSEYNLLLGMVLRDDLPDRNPKKHDGWRLVPAPKMRSKADVRKLAEEARELFGAVVKEHPGTPWAAAALRELATPPGLAWEPAVAE